MHRGDHRRHRFDTLVSVFAAGPGPGLRDGLACQHAERDGLASHCRDAGEPRAHRLGDVLIMRGFAGDHTPQRHDRVDVVAMRQVMCENRQLERTGRLFDHQVVFRPAGVSKTLDRPAAQGAGDLLVVGADRDADSKARGAVDC